MKNKTNSEKGLVEMGDNYSLSDLWITFCQNIYPSMIDYLAEDLGVEAESIKRLGVGFYPLKQAFIFAERDENGQIIGLVQRYKIRGKLKKHCWPGSKRGLSYECLGVKEKKRYQRKNNFVRIHNVGVTCPICGRDDWCMVSDDNIRDPSVVICGPTSEGAERYIEGSGYLHRRKKTNSNSKLANSILPDSNKPYLVVEGRSDVLAAMDMGYVAIGKPSAQAGNDILAKLVKGKDVIVLGENDPEFTKTGLPHEVGQRGMESTFQTLKPKCKSAIKILPPDRFKDLREWHPAVDEFEAHIEKYGDRKDDDKILPTKDPYFLGKKWLNTTQYKNEQLLLRHVQDDLYKYNGLFYIKKSKRWLKNQLYPYFAGRSYKQQKGNVQQINSLEMPAYRINDIIEVVNSLCYTDVPEDFCEPFNLVANEQLDLTQAMVFKNGIYHVLENRLDLLTPDIFITSILPYNYKPHAHCNQWKWFVESIFGGDEECVALLQEWFGYCMVSSNIMEAIMFFFGPTGTGKGTTINILEKLVGKKRCFAPRLSSLTNRFGLSSLIGKYIMTINEQRPTKKAEAEKLLQIFKQISGQDSVATEKKFKDPINTKLFCRITYAGNQILEFDDAPQALMRRANLLHFENEPDGKPDRHLKEKLAKEIEGIAIWAIEGLKRLLNNKEFTKPRVSEKYLQEFKETNNPLLLMLDETCQISNKLSVPTNQLFELYKQWCKENNYFSTTKHSFGRKLHSTNKEIYKKRIWEGSERLYIYQGIDILPEARKYYLGDLK